MNHVLKNLRGGLPMFLELIIVLAIILFLAQKAIQSYFRKPIRDKQAETMAHEAGINTSNYQSVIQSTRDKFKDISTQRQNELEFNGN